MKSSPEVSYLIGIDVGGTFTDVVLVDSNGESGIHKSFSTKGDEAQGIFNALELAAAANDETLSSMLAKTSRLVHGSTVAANALLERDGAEMGFVSTAGFRDTLVMRRMFRENMYDLRASVPPNILARQNIVEVEERIGRDGKAVIPLTDVEIERVIDTVGELDIESVGISLLFSFRNPDHELRLRDALVQAYPDLYVAVSAEIAPEIRDYERASTTALGAYLGPRVRGYLTDLQTRLSTAGLKCPVDIMRSNGGVCDIDEAVSRPTDMLLSGPAGGVVGTIGTSENLEEPNVISFDMGGTSCDISVIHEGEATSSTFLAKHSRFEGWDVLTPFLDIQALGSGGGSIAWLDAADGLHVGPQSAGSRPGPACYGNGGESPTVTDANLWLGYLNPDYFLDQQIPLDRGRTGAALEPLASSLGMSKDELAAGIFEIVNAAMVGRLSVVLAEKGYDAREFTLMCFGGAGAAHAPAFLSELGLRKVVVPSAAPAFSAAGLLRSDRQYDEVTSRLTPLLGTDISEVRDAFEAMRGSVRSRPTADADQAWTDRLQVEMRYQGQTHDIRVDLGGLPNSVDEIREAFEKSYKASFGYLNSPELIQLVNLRLSSTQETEKPRRAPIAESKEGGLAVPKASRKAHFAEVGGYVEVDVFDGPALTAGSSLEGPAIVEMPATTIVVRPDQKAEMDSEGNFVIEATNRSESHV